jgi:hypothetical protein
MKNIWCDFGFNNRDRDREIDREIDKVSWGEPQSVGSRVKHLKQME